MTDSLREAAVNNAKAQFERARTTTEKHEARRALRIATRALEAEKEFERTKS